LSSPPWWFASLPGWFCSSASGCTGWPRGGETAGDELLGCRASNARSAARSAGPRHVGYQPRPSSYSRQADCQPAHHRAARLDLNRPRRVEGAFLKKADGVEHASGGNPWLATSHRDSPFVRQAMTQPLLPYCARSTQPRDVHRDDGAGRTNACRAAPPGCALSILSSCRPERLCLLRSRPPRKAPLMSPLSPRRRASLTPPSEPRIHGVAHPIRRIGRWPRGA
jgi:hypothetical protein